MKTEEKDNKKNQTDEKQLKTLKKSSYLKKEMTGNMKF